METILVPCFFGAKVPAPEVLIKVVSFEALH